MSCIFLYIFFSEKKDKAINWMMEGSLSVIPCHLHALSLSLALPPLGVIAADLHRLCLDPLQGLRQDLMTFIIRWRQEFNLSRRRCQRWLTWYGDHAGGKIKERVITLYVVWAGALRGGRKAAEGGWQKTR